MDKRIVDELATFERNLNTHKLGAYQVRRIDAWGMLILPHDSMNTDDVVDLTILALNHGDEVGGIVVLNRLCAQIASGALVVNKRIALLLGNVEAAKVSKRFVERDINRSYMSTQGESIEQKRAKEIEPILKRSRFVLDFHQTIEPTSSPFFVYYYNDNAALFANFIAPTIPVITHKQSTAAKMGGMRCDEFGTHSGCVSIALEISQKGYDEEGIEFGLKCASRALLAVEQWAAIQAHHPSSMNPMWTWAHIEAYPEQYISLKPGLKNFELVKQGQVIGYSQSDTPFTVAIDGALLFPKYIKPGEKKPVEIFRLLKQVHYFERHQVTAEID